MLKLKAGLKTDPIEYRYSYEWLFSLMAEEGIKYAQIGSFFEIYQLPNEFFHQLKEKADKYGIEITSVFTAHRELGGFFMEEKSWQQTTRKNFERFIEVGSILGATSVGSNPGALLRDKIENKARGVNTYLSHMKELMHFAFEKDIEYLTMEPMSCLAEPPTLPNEIIAMCNELINYHKSTPQTAKVGCCTDVSHGYADIEQNVIYDNIQLLKAALPYTTELHLKNTDPLFNSTFGFTSEERYRGIVDVAQIQNILLDHWQVLPVNRLICYLEIGGPKTGRDYSDHLLENQLRESLRYIQDVFSGKLVNSGAN